ncbi:MAG: ASCH domain-containing protein [Candidatus Bathyarchaeota archaeon]|nr:ASCH domain-containing protein [Candidatus Bathyarchaeota archaeon]
MGRKLTEYPPEVTRYWETFKRRFGVPDGTHWEAWAFGDNPRLADELLRLVLKGKKRGTADILPEYEAKGEPIPEVGGYSVILDGRGKPAAVIRTTRVEIKPYMEVTAEFAYSEGEDDRTLESWRREHRKYWTRTLTARGENFDESSLVVTETFELAYPEK